MTQTTRRALLAAIPTFAFAVAASFPAIALEAQAALPGAAGDGLGGLLPEAAGRAALAAFTGVADGRHAMLTEKGRAGLFAFSNADWSALIAADPGQGVSVAPASDTSGAGGAWIRAGIRHDGVTPEMFGFVCEDGATAANDIAFERCIALASSLLWRETHVAADPGEVEGLPIRLAQDKYRYSGRGIDHSAGGVTKCLDIRGKGSRRTLFVIEREVFLFAWGDTSALTIEGIHFSGGKGIYVQTGSGNNVRDTYRVFDVRAEGFTVCAFGSNSVDMPYWSVTWCKFHGADEATALAFSGNTDLCEVGYCEFLGMRYHIKADRGGISARFHDNFHATLAHPDGARIWAVLTGESANKGLGGVLRDTKFGNEGVVNPADRVFIAAEEDMAEANFYDRHHSPAVSRLPWQGWHIDGCAFLGAGGSREAYFTFFTPAVVGLTIGNGNKVAGSRRPFFFAFERGIGAVAAESDRRNDIRAPLDYLATTAAPMPLCNLPGFAAPPA